MLGRGRIADARRRAAGDCREGSFVAVVRSAVRRLLRCKVWMGERFVRGGAAGLLNGAECFGVGFFHVCHGLAPLRLLAVSTGLVLRGKRAGGGLASQT